MYGSIEARRSSVDPLDNRHKAPDPIPTTMKSRKNVMYNKSFFYIQLNYFVYFKGLDYSHQGYTQVICLLFC